MNRIATDNETHMIGAAPSAGLPAGVGVVSSVVAVGALTFAKRNDDELLGAAAGSRSMIAFRAPLPTTTTEADDDDGDDEDDVEPVGRSHCVVLVV